MNPATLMAMAARVAVLLVAASALLSSVLEASDDRRNGSIVTVEHHRSEMVLIPGGTFVMGIPDTELENAREACDELFGEWARYICFHQQDEFDYFRDATPSRDVFVSSFEIDRYEVTLREYRKCVAAGVCDVGPLVTHDDRYLEDPLPMVNTTWQDAVDYCSWKDKRLPTEAEWEKAARGTDGRRWPWGNQERKDGLNHGKLEDEAVAETIGKVTGWRAGRQTMPALVYVPDDSDGYKYAAGPGDVIWGESPFGVYDMAGNVSEWVADYYWAGEIWRPRPRADTKPLKGGYDDLPDIDPHRQAPRDERHRVVRGGSWVEPKLYARTYRRDHDDPNVRSIARGFRCARDAALDSE